MADDGESLESWLNKATNPSNRQEDWEYIMGFCDQINKELEGPQISVRLLAHKIQSPQEWEAMQALMVLEACMKNCGQRFHAEVGKFRFLNELIKVVSPKYMGVKVSEKVKSKVIELLYSWTLSLQDEAKICEAYQMLKSQGIVLVDPEMPPDVTLIASHSLRAKNPVFDHENKSKRLSELLKSKKPEDLQEANRIIKNMVKEDEVRTQKVTKQKSTLEAVNNSVKLLNEMLAHFSPEDSTDGDKELIQELYGDCDKLRESVIQLATETEDNDSSLGAILQASDDLSLVISSYKKTVNGQAINGESEEAQTSAKQGSTNRSEILIDLVGLEVQAPAASSLSLPVDLLCGSAAAAPPLLPSPSAASAALSLLDEELLSFGLNDPVDQSHDLNLIDTTSSLGPTFSTQFPSPDALSSTVTLFSPSNSSAATATLSVPGAAVPTPPVFPEPLATASAKSHSLVLTSSAPTVLFQSFSMDSRAPSSTLVNPQQLSAAQRASHPPLTTVNYSLQDLALLDLGSPKNTPGGMDLGSVSPTISASLLTGEMQGHSTPPLAKNQADDSPLLHSLSPSLPLSQGSPGMGQEVSLVNVFVPLDSIKPSKVSPVTAYDKNAVRVLLHFASDCPPGRPDVLVMVVSMLNTAPQPVRSVVLQAAVPKTMKVRLQPPTGTELAPFNPILPPACITQVMLLANPLKEKVRLRYKLSFTLGEQPITEVGEVNEFPPADRWGAGQTL